MTMWWDCLSLEENSQSHLKPQTQLEIVNFDGIIYLSLAYIENFYEILF